MEKLNLIIHNRVTFDEMDLGKSMFRTSWGGFFCNFFALLLTRKSTRIREANPGSLVCCYHDGRGCVLYLR